MNQFDQVSRPLEFTTIVWVALLLVGLIGLRQLLEEPSPRQTLSYLEGSHPLIIRSIAERHQFPLLGVEVELAEGWTYLSVAEDVQASTTTFLHSSAQSIVRLEPFRLVEWPPAGTEVEVESYGDWSVEWTEIDHRRVGRLREPPVDLFLIVVTHQHHARLNQEIRDFCRGIRVMR